MRHQTENLKKFKFQGNQISFESNEKSIFINASEMSKNFNKKPDDFLRNKQIKVGFSYHSG